MGNGEGDRGGFGGGVGWIWWMKWEDFAVERRKNGENGGGEGVFMGLYETFLQEK